MTPCEKLGYKLGDKFRLESSVADEMRETEQLVIILIKDDGSNSPMFYGFTIFDDDSDVNKFIDLDCVYKLDYDIQVGDVVEVARKTQNNDPDGMGVGVEWNNQWYYKMDDYIGKQFTIKTIDNYGVTFFKDVIYGFPLTSLKLISRGKIEETVDTSAESEPETTVEVIVEKPVENIVDVFKKFVNDLASGYDAMLILKKEGYMLEFDCYSWNGTEAEIINKINLLRQLHIAY